MSLVACSSGDLENDEESTYRPYDFEVTGLSEVEHSDEPDLGHMAADDDHTFLSPGIMFQCGYVYDFRFLETHVRHVQRLDLTIVRIQGVCNLGGSLTWNVECFTIGSKAINKKLEDSGFRSATYRKSVGSPSRSVVSRRMPFHGQDMRRSRRAGGYPWGSLIIRST